MKKVNKDMKKGCVIDKFYLVGLRSEVERDLNEKFERLGKEKEEVEAKLMQKKKELKDLEQTFLKQSALTDKENFILNEKLSAIEEKKKDMILAYDSELEKLNNNLKMMKAENSKEREDQANEIEFFRKRVDALEGELQARTGSNEKEQILWEGKFKFIEQQRDNFKRDLADTQKRFETLFENIQKKANLEKEKLENAQQNSISNLEQKYQSHIKEMSDNHQRIYSDLSTSNKELERELKALNMQMEYKGRTIDPSTLNKKVDELLEERERMKKELEDMKRERDVKLIQAQNMLEKEKDILKLKNTDAENRMRELESKKGVLLLEYEKDKTKWDLEKHHLDSKTIELQETIDRLMNKNENLMKDNEKLKAEKNNVKRSNSIRNNPNNVSIMNNTILTSNYTSNAYKDKDLSQYNQPKPYNPYPKDISKILDDKILSGIDSNSNSSSSSRFYQPVDRSMDRSPGKYDKFDNPYNKLVHKFSIKPTIGKTKEEENGLSDNASNK